MRQRVVDAPVEVDAIGRPADRRRALASRNRDEDVRGVVERRPARRQGKRRARLEQRAAQIERVLLRLLGPLCRLESVPRVQRVVAEHEIQAAAHRPEARLRDDVDEDQAAAVVFRREHVAREADRSDLRLGRQAAAAEPVHADRGAGARHLLQHLFHLVGIVGQRVDLILREDRVEPIVVGIGRHRRRIAADRYALVDLLNREPHLAPVLAGANAHVRQDARLEPGKARLDRVPPGDEVCGDRDTLAVGRQALVRDRPRGLVGAADVHERTRNHGAARILYDDTQGAALRPLPCVRECRTCVRRPDGRPKMPDGRPRPDARPTPPATRAPGPRTPRRDAWAHVATAPFRRALWTCRGRRRPPRTSSDRSSD